MSEEYSDTNSGAVFPPFPDQKYILQGSLDIEGAKHNVVVIKGKTKKGVDIVKFYTEFCAIFPNDKTKETAPDYTGKCNERFKFSEHDIRIAAWVKEYKDAKYMSLQMSEAKPNEEKPIDVKEKKSDSLDDILDDDIPF
tara:strand:- start:203 stop:619 length:417 start_codon:yes stop_codon:yes gene_type:complete